MIVSRILVRSLTCWTDRPARPRARARVSPMLTPCLRRSTAPRAAGDEGGGGTSIGCYCRPTGGGMRRAQPAIALACCLAAAALAACSAGAPTGATPATSPHAATAPHRPPPPSYYLALGDSLSQGVQPNPAGDSVETRYGYADLLYASLREQHPGLR